MLVIMVRFLHVIYQNIGFSGRWVVIYKLNLDTKLHFVHLGPLLSIVSTRSIFRAKISAVRDLCNNIVVSLIHLLIDRLID